MRPWLLVCLLIVTAAVGVLLAAPGDSTFAASNGFSGRYGFDCTTCHAVPPVPMPATVVLEGVPSAWEPGATYPLTIRVEGGPPAAPAVQPQGGFELDVDGGTVSRPDSMAGLLRSPTPHQMTYTPDGTLRREWQVDWTAPGLEARPATVTLYLAGLAADGNHNPTLNQSDLGELGDAVGTLQATVPPVPGALDAWRALPLTAPVVQGTTEVASGGSVTLDGRHTDRNATTLAWRLDGRPWERRDTGRDWRIVLPGLPAGDHVLQVRSEGSDRGSHAVDVPLHVQGAGLDRVTPAPVWPAVAALLTGALVRRHR